MEGRDYVSVIVPGSGEGKGSATPLKEYHAALDMAKELAMVENNEIGRSIRPQMPCTLDATPSDCLRDDPHAGP
jgi:phage anti-repressor protein